MNSWVNRLGRRLCDWLVKEDPPAAMPLCDFDRLSYEIRPADVILVEGRSRVSNVIKMITQSSWTHSALYIGRLYDIRDHETRETVRRHYDGDPKQQLVIEALLGRGTVVTPLKNYRYDHLRICRPTGLAPVDAERVIRYAAKRLGVDYDVRQLLDLARFLFPWGILPRRWRSSLFEHNAGEPTRTVCSSMLAEAFSEVDFPILPFIDRREDGRLRFFKRNPKLFAPKDFDYSPYFGIIKYPFLGLDDLGLYRRLPWQDDRHVYNDDVHPLEQADAPTAPEDETRPAWRPIPFANKKTRRKLAGPQNVDRKAEANEPPREASS